MRKIRTRLALRNKITPEELEERIRKQGEIGELGERIVMRYENARLLAIGHGQECNYVAELIAALDMTLRATVALKTINRFLEVKSTSDFEAQ